MGVEILQKSLANATVMALLEEHVASKNVITRPRSMDSAASISRLLKITLVMKQSKTLEWSSGNGGILEMNDKQNSRQDTLQRHSILRTCCGWTDIHTSQSLILFVHDLKNWSIDISYIWSLLYFIIGRLIDTLCTVFQSGKCYNHGAPQNFVASKNVITMPKSKDSATCISRPFNMKQSNTLEWSNLIPLL